MSTFIQLSQNAQRAICMLTSVVIVTASLALGAYGVESMVHDGYSVTVTQLQ